VRSVVALLAVVLAAPAARAARSCPASASTAAFTTAGKYGVGVRTLTYVDASRPTPAHGTIAALPQRTLPTEVWYPTASGAGSATPVRDAALVPRKRFPLVLVSPGYADSRTFHQYWASVLASRGYVVAAVDFPLTGVTTPAPRLPADVINQPGDVRFVLDGLLSGRAPADWLRGAIDKRRIGASGLSYGGTTTLLLTYHPTLRDKRIRATLAMAPAGCSFTEPFFRAAHPPLLILQGDQDLLVPLPENGNRVFVESRSPRELVVLVDGTHTAFAGPITFASQTSYDTAFGCTIVRQDFTAATLMSLAQTPGFIDPSNGIDVTMCGLPCQAASPTNAPMPAARQHELTIAVTSAFFESALRHTAPAKCFLRRGLAAGNPDVHVSLHAGGR